MRRLFFTTTSISPYPFRARLLHALMDTSRQLINILSTIGSTNGAPSDHTLEFESQSSSLRWAAFVFGTGRCPEGLDSLPAKFSPYRF